MRWPTVGIRGRIVVGSVLLTALLGIIAAVILIAQVDRVVRGGTDFVLRSDAAPYVGALTDDPGEELDPPGPGQLVAVLSPAGASVVDSLPPGVLAAIDARSPRSETFVIPGGSGEYLVATFEVTNSDGTWMVIAARSADEERVVATPMHLMIGISVLAIVLGVGAGSWLLTTAVLAPVRSLRTSAARLAVEASSELLPVGRSRDEIADLAADLNRMITELRAAASRERHLIADASHELRTPVAVVRTRLDLAAVDFDADAPKLRAEIVAARRGVERLTRMLDRLLELSAIESGSFDGSSSWEELVHEAEDAIDRLGFHASLAEVDVVLAADDVVGAPRGRIGIRPDDVGRILDNLLGNAARAGEGPRRIVVALESGTRSVRLRVSDDAGGMSEELAERAWNRFTRGRVESDGAGLGLPIVAALVARAGGAVELRNVPGTGVDVILDLPLQPGGSAMAESHGMPE